MSVVHVKKSQILTTFPKWGHSYKVEFDITVNEVPTAEWTNIFHFTKGENLRRLGDRIPAAWINSRGYIQISSSVNQNKDVYIHYDDFTIGKKHHYTIQQLPDSDGLMKFTIEIDGKVMKSMVNNNPQDYENVKLYVSDPWHDSFQTRYGKLENLHAYQDCF